MLNVNHLPAFSGSGEFQAPVLATQSAAEVIQLQRPGAVKWPGLMPPEVKVGIVLADRSVRGGTILDNLAHRSWTAKGE